MEYNELINRMQQASVDAPDAENILAGMRCTVHRRRMQQQVLLSSVLVLAVIAPAFLLQYGHNEARITLAEQVSLKIDTKSTRTPAPIVGYRHSMYNRQIYTLL